MLCEIGVNRINQPNFLMTRLKVGRLPLLGDTSLAMTKEDTKAHEPEELRLSVGPLELAAQRWKMGNLPVLALHGWLDNSGTYDRLAPYLEGCDLVCLDLPGHGLSEHRPEGIPYHFVDWIPDVFSAADSLGWERFSLLGHSMGAAIASVAAGTLPDRIESLVLIEGLGPFANPDEEAPEVLQKSLHHKVSKGRRVYPSKAKAQKRLEARGLTPEGAVCLLNRALQPEGDGWAFSYAKRAMAPSRARPSEGQVRAFLRRISCPTLLIKATEGLAVPPSYLERETEISDMRVETVEGGHHLHLDAPERVQGIIRDFLARR